MPCLLVIRRRGDLNWPKLKELTRLNLPEAVEAWGGPDWIGPMRKELLS